MISIADLAMNYGKKTLFEKSSVTFNPGKSYGLVGANGSGKTTILKTICGTTKPEYGTIHFNDEQIDAIRPQTHDTHHWETDFIFQQPGNHIFRVDLYDAAKDGGVLTYVFNMSTQSPFGYIFFASLIAGGMILGGVLCFIYIPKIIKSRS